MKKIILSLSVLGVLFGCAHWNSYMGEFNPVAIRSDFRLPYAIAFYHFSLNKWPENLVQVEELCLARLNENYCYFQIEDFLIDSWDANQLNLRQLTPIQVLDTQRLSQSAKGIKEVIYPDQYQIKTVNSDTGEYEATSVNEMGRVRFRFGIAHGSTVIPQ